MIDKNELKKKYKETLTPMGVYKIENKINKKIFIGSSLNITARFNRHQMELKFGSEDIKELLDDYNKYGLENFEFRIVDLLKRKDDPTYNYRKDLAELENMWLEELQPYGERGYNKIK
ncbi:MAG: GIY-YIG nuclease family protein [bacterium]